MAVPPVQRSQTAAAAPAGPIAAARFPWLLDVVLGLLVVAALPLAIVAIPNTVSWVSELLPASVDKLALFRAHGLALPAMMLTVPLAAVAVRHTKAAPILLGGLALLAVADAAGGFADSATLVGVLRVLHGVGAGLLIPATLVAVWDRPPVLRALWAAMLAMSLLAAQALALQPIDKVTAWQVTLQPYPLLTGIALALAAIYFVLWLVRGQKGTPGPRAAERSRLLMATVPAAGIAVVAIGTTFNTWEAGLVVLVAMLALTALLALASIGTFEGPAGRFLAYAMVAVGAVLLPSAAQITTLEVRGLGGPGLIGLWLPFGIVALMALAGAVSATVLPVSAMQTLSGGGLIAIVLGLATVRLMVPVEQGLLLIIPFGLLAVGAAVALTASLRLAGVGAALFGLSLCFPAVLAGFLLGSGVQTTRLRAARSGQELVDGFVGALQVWALIAGFLVIAVIVLAAVLARRSAGGAGSPAPRTAGDDSGKAEREPVQTALLVPAQGVSAESSTESDAPPHQDLVERVARESAAREAEKAEREAARAARESADREAAVTSAGEPEAAEAAESADASEAEVAEAETVEESPGAARGPGEEPEEEAAQVAKPEVVTPEVVKPEVPPVVEVSAQEGEREAGEGYAEREKPVKRAGPDRSAPAQRDEGAIDTGPIPVVPPPAQSPEDDAAS